MGGIGIRDTRLEIRAGEYDRVFQGIATDSHITDRPWALKVLKSLLNERDAAYEREMPVSAPNSIRELESLLVTEGSFSCHRPSGHVEE